VYGRSSESLIKASIFNLDSGVEILNHGKRTCKMEINGKELALHSHY